MNTDIDMNILQEKIISEIRNMKNEIMTEIIKLFKTNQVLLT